jgi:rod shape-determining protein RodA
MVVGIAAIGVSQRADPSIRSYTAKQIIFACIGLGAFIAATLIPYQKVGRAAYGLFAVTLVLLVVVFLLKPIRGSHRWIDLGAFQVQPSEIAKVTFVVLLAWYLRYGDRYRRLRGLVIPFVLTFLPMGLILKEPDLGTSLIFLPTLYFMLFMAGAKLRHLLGIVAVGTALVLLPVPHRASGQWSRTERADRLSLAYGTFRTGAGTGYLVSAAPLALMEQRHQISRIVGWLRQDDPRVAMGKGYHLRQSKITLGSGRLTGRPGRSADPFFRMLPDDHTDFIFSVIGGQWGFAGCVGLMALYGVIFLFGVEIAASTHDPFGRLLAVGVLGLLLTQLVINIGMTMGLMPITGMTLPLVSYGGSSLVANCVALGLLVNVGQRRPILLGRRPFEYGQKREKAVGPTGPLADGAWRRKDDDAHITSRAGSTPSR